MNKELDNKAAVTTTTQLEQDVVLLRNKVAGELTGGRWLWTTGQLNRDANAGSGNPGSVGSSSWIPWDTEVINAAPAILCWKRGVTAIKTRLPGLYKVTISIFTTLPCAIQLCLNGEPIITLQPDLTVSSNAAGVGNLNGSMLTGHGGGGGSHRPALVSDER